MNFVIIGTGYVADSYMATLSAHPELKMIGAFDADPAHLEAFSKRWPTKRYSDLREVLDDREIELIVNLTNPRSHFELNRQCLEAGKHVYSEKPLAMTYSDAELLVRLAKERGLKLSSAPCSLLGTTAQTLWKAIRDGVAGRIRLTYASFDDGMIAPHMAPWTWRNDYGVAWPAKDEFEVGCTYEHAGYVLTWLAAFFGPARRVTAFSSCLIPEKGIPVEAMAPDFSVGCIEYRNGVVARVTCGLVAPLDKSISVVGDAGVVYTSHVRNDDSPVYMLPMPADRFHGGIERRLTRLREGLERVCRIVPWAGGEWRLRRKLPFARPINHAVVAPRKRVDFFLGPVELAAAVREGRPCRLSAELGAHIVELTEALQYPERFGNQRDIVSTFDPITPLEMVATRQ